MLGCCRWIMGAPFIYVSMCLRFFYVVLFFYSSASAPVRAVLASSSRAQSGGGQDYDAFFLWRARKPLLWVCGVFFKWGNTQAGETVVSLRAESVNPR